MIVANGRVSDRSFTRSRKFGFFVRRLYGLVTRFAMQSRLYAERAIGLGAPAERVTISGNLKFEIGDVNDSPKIVETANIFALDSAPLVIAGSTTDGEEEMVISAFEELRKENVFKRVRLLIAPRHPERFDIVARSLKSSRLRVARRSSSEGGCMAADVILLDTVGELAALYRFASAVFVGGSLVPKGGHNILEPAGLGRPVVFGPFMDNFQEEARLLLGQEAAVQVGGVLDLAVELEKLFSQPQRAHDLGARARQAVAAMRGATALNLALIQALLPAGGRT